MRTRIIDQATTEAGGGSGAATDRVGVGAERDAVAALRASEERLRLLFETMGEGVAVMTLVRDEAGRVVDTRYLELNPAFERLTGRARDGVVGRRTSEVFPLHFAAMQPRLATVTGTAGPERFEAFIPETGRWLSCYAAPFGGPDGFAVFFDDITERKRAERRQEYLLQLSDALRPLTDPVAIQQAAIGLLGRHFGASRALYVEIEADDVHVVVHRDYTDGVPSFAGRYRFDAFGSGFVRDLRAGRTVTMADAEREPLLGEAERRVYAAGAIRAFIGVPLVKDGRLAATLSVHAATPRAWTADEVMLVEETAERTWAAVELSRVRRRTEALNTLLVRFSEEVRGLTEPHAVAEVACRLVAGALGAERAYWAEVDWATREYVVGPAYQGSGVPAITGRFPLDAWEPCSAWQLAGQPVVVDDTQADTRLPPALRAGYAQIAVGADLAVPVVVDGQLRCAFAVNQRRPRRWTPEEVALVHGIADRCWAEVERARAEAALRASEAKYRALFEQMDEAFAVVEVLADAGGRWADFRFLDANPAFVRHTGMPEPVGRTATELLGTPNPRWAALYGRAVDTGESIRVEETEPTLDRVFDLNIFRLGGPGSRRVAVLFADITARTRAEAALRASEARQTFFVTLGDALRPLADPVAVQAEACRCLGEHLGVDRVYYGEIDEAAGVARVERDWVREGAPSLAGVHRTADFGWSVAILRSGDFAVVSDTQTSPLVPPEERPPSAAIGIIACIGAPLIKAGRLVGALCAAQATPRVWTDAEVALVGEVAERVWAAVERARAEAALRESEARFRAVADLVPDLLWESEPDGSTSWYNARWREYTGQTLAQASGWGWVDALHPEDRAGAAADYAGAAARAEPLVREHRIRRHDGAYRWFLVRAEPLRDETGRIVRWFGAATDMHAQRLALEEVERLAAHRTAERDALRRALAQAEEAERRRLARELHDQLGQELTAFRLGLDDALRLAAGHDGAEGSAADDGPLYTRLMQLQALAARMTAGARYLALELRPPELDDLGFESALESYVAEWSARYDIAAEVAVTGLRGRAVPPDVASALYRIAQEALTNVAKHARASQVSVIVDQPDGEVRLIVEDDGRGFDPEAAYARARAERRLGLASMGERAALAGGMVAVESSPGAGTTLYARLPVAPVDAPVDAPVNTPAGDLAVDARVGDPSAEDRSGGGLDVPAEGPA